MASSCVTLCIAGASAWTIQLNVLNQSRFSVLKYSSYINMLSWFQHAIYKYFKSILPWWWQVKSQCHMFTLNYIFFPAFFNLLMSWFHEKPFTGYSLWKFILHFYFWWNPNVNDWFREWIDIYLLTESPLNNAGSIKKVIQEKALPRKVNYNKRVFFFKRKL